MEAEVEAEAAALAAAGEQRKAEGLLGAQAVGVGANAAAPAVETAPMLEELAANLHSEWFESVGEGGTWGGSDGDGASGATPGTAPKTQCRKGVCGWSCEME